MNGNRRVQDVTQVFDNRWNVNNDYRGRKEFLDGRRQHFNKMYNIQDRNVQKEEILRANSVDGKIESLNQKMSAANSGERIAKMNNFRNNFR